MKKKITFIIALIAIGHISYSQATKSNGENAATQKANSESVIIEPEFANTPMWFDESDNTLKNFERPAVNQSASLSSPFSANMYIAIAGMTSPTRFNSQKMPKIYIKTTSENIDPNTVTKFVSFVISKKKLQREYLVGKGGIGGVTSTISTISIDFKKVKPGVYEIIFLSPLQKGEYSFAVGDMNKNATPSAFCLTIYDGHDNAQTQGKDAKGRPIVN
ncbi:MAG: hypothetical protein KF706_07115 [Chitinophagales bacterium]|nr:hypothetical protein [Chitinophagales bacterium]